MGTSIYYEADGHTLIVHLPKELDHHNCRKLRCETDLLMAENYISHLIFDFGKTAFMDSSGIGLLLNRYKQIRGSGGRVSCYGAGAQVMRILKVGGVLGLVTQYPSKEDALRG